MPTEGYNRSVLISLKATPAVCQICPEMVAQLTRTQVDSVLSKESAARPEIDTTPNHVHSRVLRTVRLARGRAAESHTIVTVVSP